MTRGQTPSIAEDLRVDEFPARRLRASIMKVEKLTSADKARMLALMQKYYDGVTEKNFLQDLGCKSHVILLTDDSIIRGFSTLVSVKIICGGRPLCGVFSGDTVIEKEYWGQRALGSAFLRHLFFRKLMRPFSPLYWLLITKGYKTYLLMANNFSEHYPRYEKATPVKTKTIIDDFYTKLFPGSYDPATGLISFTGDACRLKEGVASVPDEIAAQNPRIAFFERANPGWREGVELACLARMTLLMPLKYAIKKLLKKKIFL